VAVGTDGPVLFPGDAQWSPPLGWAPWIVLAVVGAGCLAAAAISAPRHPARARPDRS
jgi:hypothetical protein